MKEQVLLGALLALTVGASLPQHAPPAPTRVAEVGSDGLIIDVPATWQPGYLRGPTILMHFIGANDGYPQFSAMHDPEAALPADTLPEQERESVEEMFHAIAGDGASIEQAGWVEIHGIAVHSSLSTRNSVAGAITHRRALFVHGGVPYVLSWAHRAGEYPALAELIEHCVGSLRPGRAPGKVAALASPSVATRPAN